MWNKILGLFLLLVMVLAFIIGVIGIAEIYNRYQLNTSEPEVINLPDLGCYSPSEPSGKFSTDRYGLPIMVVVSCQNSTLTADFYDPYGRPSFKYNIKTDRRIYYFTTYIGDIQLSGNTFKVYIKAVYRDFAN